MSKKLKLSEIRNSNHKLGNALLSKYNKEKDLNIANSALSAYRLAIRAVKMQLVYKEMTGNPQKIEYLD